MAVDTRVKAGIHRFLHRLRRERKLLGATAARVKARLARGLLALPADFALLLELTRTHRLPLRAWGNSLAKHLPEEYATRPLSPSPTTAPPGTPGRIEVYARRWRRGHAIFPFADVTAAEANGLFNVC